MTDIWCPVEDLSPAADGTRRWECEELSWVNHGVTFEGLSFREAQEYTVALLQVACGVGIRITNSRGNGNLNSHERRIDGPGGVLARHWLPGFPSRCHESLRGEWDGSDRITQRQLNHVTLHEICHGLGLSHVSGRDSVMNPRLNMSTYGRIDEWTRRQLVERYGEPDEKKPPPPATKTWEEFHTHLQTFFAS